jgi:hypothetical protein
LKFNHGVVEFQPFGPLKPYPSPAAGSLPAKAGADALHIAVAAVHGMHYLLSWNCAHIANAMTRRKIESACRRAGYDPPMLCTPRELMEVSDDEIE